MSAERSVPQTALKMIHKYKHLQREAVAFHTFPLSLFTRQPRWIESRANERLDNLERELGLNVR